MANDRFSNCCYKYKIQYILFCCKSSKFQILYKYSTAVGAISIFIALWKMILHRHTVPYLFYSMTAVYLIIDIYETNAETMVKKINKTHFCIFDSDNHIVDDQACWKTYKLMLKCENQRRMDENRAMQSRVIIEWKWHVYWVSDGHVMCACISDTRGVQ